MINEIFNRKSEYTKNIFILLTGSFIGQLIPVLLSPIVTRIYSPEDFGIFALFFAVVMIIGNIINARYEHAIMLPKEEKEAINIFALGVLISFFISIILQLSIFLFYNDFVFYTNKDITYWLYLVPFSTFFIGFFNLLSQFNNRKKNYKDISTATVYKSIILVFSQISIGLIKPGSFGLVFGEIFSRVFANYKLLKNIIEEKIFFSSISKKELFFVAKKYKEFPLYNLPSSLADIITSHLAFILFPKIFSLGISGSFLLAQKIIFLPSSLIAKSVSHVLFQKMTENINLNIKNMPLLIGTIKKLFLIAGPISFIIYFYSPYLFTFIFGEQWKSAGEIAQYLSLIFFITFLSSTVSITLIAYRKLKTLAKWQYLYFCSSILFFSVFFVLEVELYDFLFYYVIHECIIYSIYLFIIIKTVRDMDKLIEE
ncbi:lipopolysaccharide biosynthesis protein [Halarcobacter sp.]|uniref:lipopolysaccharide biosynthesis protein n=1 Tax=Halarcobacter sp. TaxID=2321133 RepID=UPI003B010093